MNLKTVKSKIIATKKTSQVTRAMEAVSAVKMRKSQERALSGRAYAAAALSILRRFAGTADAERHPLMHERAGKICIVIITSDKGLAGSLNGAVIKKVEQETAARGLAKSDIVVLAVGRRGGDYFASRGFDVRAKHENVGDDVSEANMRMVTDALLEMHASGKIGACLVAYQNFLSTFEQEASVRQVLPITAEMMAEIVKNIRSAKGKYAPREGEEEKGPDAYTVEPEANEVLRFLLPRLINVAVFHAMLEAKASEHSARMVAMKNATDQAKEMAHELTRTFNKVRQAAITREVSEITSGIEAMK